MGVKFLLTYLERKAANDEIVDFIEVAGGHKHDQMFDENKKMTLVLDGESCLNRLYGGYYSDWICGGQWLRMSNFIRDLVTKVKKVNIELVVFFNGAIEPQRMNEWISNQKADYIRYQKILSQINKTNTVPKNTWVAPVGLRCAIRTMLREVMVNVVSTIDDHRQEVIAYCRENNVYGLIADDAEYIAFNPPRIFSAMHLKLRYRGMLETKQYKILDFMNEFDLNEEKLCVLAALLGNYLLPDKELSDVYKKAGVDIPQEHTPEIMIPKLAAYINQLNISMDLNDVVRQILGCDDDRAVLLKQSIQYYLNGTKDGFLKYRSTGKFEKAKIKNDSVDTIQEPDLDTTALASEKAGTEKNILNQYEQASACLESEQEDTKVVTSEADNSTISSDSKSDDESLKSKKLCMDEPRSPQTCKVDQEADISIDSAESKSTMVKVKKEKVAPILPHVQHEVMRTLSERHSKGLMSPYIYQILSQGEIKLPSVLENGNEVPDIYSFYKPIRQMVYAIVFNLHHHKYLAAKENKPLAVDIRIKEWIYNKTEKVHKPEYVKAEPVGWGVPTIQRLWFGTLQDDKRRRLRAFLTCMRSDVQLILNPDFVPQELLMAAVVLRYIMSFPDKRILRKQELDAFIVTALTLDLDPQVLQELQARICSRNVQLAVLFMKGVEMALLANDACGAPIPWLMCCPWLFFDGKLFNHTFQKAVSSCKNLQELCGSRLGVVLRAERMRQAILEGLDVQFARPPIPPLLANVEANSGYQQRGYVNMNRMRSNQQLPPSANRSMPGENHRGRRSVGGRLEVAGVVVGSWGANYNMQQSYDQSQYMISPPQVSPISASSYNNYGYRARPTFNPTPKGRSFKFYGAGGGGAKKKIMNNKKERKPGHGRGMTIGSSATADADLLNGNGTNNSNETFEKIVVNGGTTLEEENIVASSLKSEDETSSSLVETVSK